MDYNGDVLMCPHDWGKKIILGNMNNSSFKEIWTSNKAKKIRDLLKKQIEIFHHVMYVTLLVVLSVKNTPKVGKN